MEDGWTIMDSGVEGWGYKSLRYYLTLLALGRAKAKATIL